MLTRCLEECAKELRTNFLEESYGGLKYIWMQPWRCFGEDTKLFDGVHWIGCCGEAGNKVYTCRS